MQLQFGLRIEAWVEDAAWSEELDGAEHSSIPSDLFENMIMRGVRKLCILLTESESWTA